MIKDIKITTGQWVAIILTAVLGCIILFCSINMTSVYNSRLKDIKPPILIYYGQNPPNPSMATDVTNYSTLTSAINNNTGYIYNMIVIDTLLPIFNALLTAVIAFIFIHNTSIVLREHLAAKNNNARQEEGEKIV